MKIKMSGAVKFVRSRMAVMLFTAILMAPAAAFSQVQEEEEDPAAIGNDPQVEERPSSTTTGPWQNSAGSTVGTATEDNNDITTPATTTPRNPAQGAGTLARPAGGSTTDGRDPGGNPDVPFDDNMNLAFLAAGLAFAFFVFRKRLGLKTVPVNNK